MKHCFNIVWLNWRKWVFWTPLLCWVEKKVEVKKCCQSRCKYAIEVDKIFFTNIFVPKKKKCFETNIIGNKLFTKKIGCWNLVENLFSTFQTVVNINNVANNFILQQNCFQLQCKCVNNKINQHCFSRTCSFFTYFLNYFLTTVRNIKRRLSFLKKKFFLLTYSVFLDFQQHSIPTTILNQSSGIVSVATYLFRILSLRYGLSVSWALSDRNQHWIF